VRRLADQSIEVLQHLARRGSAWPEASAAAIRDLRSRMMRHTINTPKRDQDDISNDDARQPHRKSPDPIAVAPHFTTSAPEAIHVPLNDSDYGPVAIGRAEQSYSGASWVAVGMQPQSSFVNDWRQQDIAYNHDNATSSTFLHGHLVDQGNDPGYLDMLDPFSGFDIPFWFEQDQHWDVFQDHPCGN
jgi:hypothetical protein